jgi:hypothetical protein
MCVHTFVSSFSFSLTSCLSLAFTFLSVEQFSACIISITEQEMQARPGRKTALCKAVTHCQVPGVDQVVALLPFSSDTKATFSDYQKINFAYAKTLPAFINVQC